MKNVPWEKLGEKSVPARWNVFRCEKLAKNTTAERNG